MNAMLAQLDPQTVLRNFGDIAKAGKQIMSTSIPASELDTFIGLALEAKSLPISSVSFVPPKIDTGDPDFDLIRTMVDDAIDSSEARDDTTSDGTRAHRKRGNANHSADLADSC